MLKVGPNCRRVAFVFYSGLGTTIVATEAKAAGVKTFIFLSSVMVYGFIFLPDIDESGVLNGA